MEPAQKITPSFNMAVFKEPRGIIKIIQFVLSIFAFATCTSVRTSSSFTAKCAGQVMPLYLPFSYPFDLESTCLHLPVCSQSGTNDTLCLPSGAKGPAEFYVFVGVFVFLYCLAAIVLYVLFDALYKKYTWIVVVDFVTSIVLTLLWLISSSIWASGVSNIKENTNPANIGWYGPSSKVIDCRQQGSCSTDSLGNFASLNVSIIFGFLNFLVWLGNLWFLYKETPWFKVQAKPPAPPGVVSETDPQRV